MSVGYVHPGEGCWIRSRRLPNAENQGIPLSIMDAPQVVSLFAGCGGLDLGFKELGFNLIHSCDNDPAAVDCYARNVDERVFVRDVTSQAFHDEIRRIGSCDVVIGGFPCQGFSKAGPKQESDARNVLYVEMKRTVATLHPQVFVAENVDGLSQNFGGAYLDRVAKDFGELGYHLEHRILDAAAFGLPQHRRRIFFVGLREGGNGDFVWPAPTHGAAARNGEFKVQEHFPLWETPKPTRLVKPVTINDAIGDLLELDDAIPDHSVTDNWPKKYAAVFKAIGRGQKLCNVRHAKTSVYTWEVPEVFGAVTERERAILETIAKHRRHKEYGAIPNGNPLPIAEIERLADITEAADEIDSLLKKGYIKEKYGKYDLKGAMFCSGLFKRPKWNEPCQTVLTNFYNPRFFLHPLKDRPFSLRECARLQGFPDSFILTSPVVDLVAGYRLVGNAVPPPLSRLFAHSIAALLPVTTG